MESRGWWSEVGVVCSKFVGGWILPEQRGCMEVTQKHRHLLTSLSHSAVQFTQNGIPVFTARKRSLGASILYM